MVFLSAETASAELVPVWGQAYSSHVGWINFYCQSGQVVPTPGIGVGAMTSNCYTSGTNYGVLYDTADGSFKSGTWNGKSFNGYAYNSVAGWLDLNGLALSNYDTFVDAKIQGTTTFGNFGKTYFQEGL